MIDKCIVCKEVKHRILVHSLNNIQAEVTYSIGRKVSIRTYSPLVAIHRRVYIAIKDSVNQSIRHHCSTEIIHIIESE